MSQSKKKITELHRKAAIEKSAKENMYRIAVESIRTYLRVIEKAGVLITIIYDASIKQSIKDRSIELKHLGNYKDFILEEVNRPITFKEYLQRRKSGTILTLLFDWLFNESFRKRFINKNKDVDQDYHTSEISYEIHKASWNELSKEIQKFHIMQDIISETKTTEAAMLQKYNLQKEELLLIIQSIQKELKGIETQNATEPIGDKDIKS
jgi:hypothetical protein